MFCDKGGDQTWSPPSVSPRSYKRGVALALDLIGKRIGCIGTLAVLPSATHGATHGATQSKLFLINYKY